MKWPPTEACAQRGSFLRACTGDTGEIQGRYRGDTRRFSARVHEGGEGDLIWEI